MQGLASVRCGNGPRIRLELVAAVVLVMFGLAAGAGAAELRVVPGGLASGACSTWAEACDLEHAWAIAAAGDEIWVAAGTYLPGPARDDSFTLEAGVEVYGGFNGTETVRSQRDWVANVTTLSGDIGVQGDDSDNSYHVVDFSGADTTAILDGFVVTQGTTATTWPDYHGAGIYGDGGGATLRHLLVTGNSTYYSGGGIYNDGGSLVIDSTVVENNEITSINGDGGGIYSGAGSLVLTGSRVSGCNGRLGGGVRVYQGDATIEDVRIETNTATVAGGGLSLSSPGTVTIARVVFAGNSGPYGGGLSNSSSNGFTTIVDSRFVRNVASAEGGGINNQGAADMVNVVFYGNSAESGGGLRNYAIGTPNTTTVSNALFVGNSATSQGGGCYSEIPDTGAAFALLNATFVANHSDGSGGGYHNSSGAPPAALIANSIFRGNTAVYEPQIGSTYAEAAVTYSDVEGGHAGAGNIDADPVFWRVPDPGLDGVWGTDDDDYGDLHVSDAGAVVDAGDTSLVVVPVDLDRAARVTDMPGVPDTGIGSPVVDMGAYEAGLIFLDGFETGTTSGWSVTVG